MDKKIEDRTKKMKIALEYIIAIIVTMIIFIFVMQLWRADINVPFCYENDALYTGMNIKTIIDSGWYLTNNYVGVPSGLNMAGYTMAEGINFIIIKFISIFSDNYAFVMNTYYIFTYVLASISALFVFRQFKLRYVPSLLGAVLFSFMPYHFLRNVKHLFLSSYYMIPLIIMVILWVYTNDNIILYYDKENKRLKSNLKSYKSISSIIICLLIGSTGIYYAFFASFFLIILIILKKGDIRKLIVPIILIILICISVLINLIPSIIYQCTNGVNPEVATRSAIESEFYQMKITQLFMPLSSHGINILDRLIKKYSEFPIPNEGSEYLGIVGSIGCIMLFYKLLKKSKESLNENIIRILSKLNISAILLATVGGFGTIFALVISPQIRAYNRISIYIAFFSIFTVVILLNNIEEKYFKSEIKRIVFVIIAFIILLIGIYDQVPKTLIPNYDSIKEEYMSDELFVKSIEDKMPKNSMIFQMPYVPFPENPPVNNMGDYELFKGYLHSNNLKWSYGSFKGEQFDLWQREISNLPIEEMIEKIILKGFDGIYIDRAGFNDKSIEENIGNIVKSEPIISNDKRLVFYDISEYAKKLRNEYTNEEWNYKEYMINNPLILSWNGEFSNLEGTKDNNWRWCSNNGELDMNNTSDISRKIKLEMKIFTGYKQFSEFKINSELFEDNIQVNSDGQEISKTIIVPPGNHIIKFSSNAQPIINEADPRNLVFRVVDFKCSEEK